MSNNPILSMTLLSGTVLIECFPDLAPNHVAQILDQANRGLYDGTIFHRVIEGFMAQGGWTHQQLPQLQAEFNSHPHIEGVCSMARTNDPNSASDQFFICFGDVRFLDNQYTVWGKVIYGMHHVHHGINKGEPPTEPTPILKMREVTKDILAN
jgi:peptidylprolyl isomerase